MLKRIPVNVWDDFWGDGCIPEGEIQSTHAYIEEYDKITDEQKVPMMRVVYDFIKTLDMPGVEIDDGDGEIYFKHLTHERLDRLMQELEESKLAYNGIPFDFYSES